MEFSFDKKKGDSREKVSSLVPRVGIEPTLCCQNWILNPARLPVPPPKQAGKNIKTFHLYSILLNNY